MTADHPTSTVVLRALDGRPLADPEVRRVVLAAARALAERHGVTLERLDARPDHLRATLRTSRLAAVGFAAELRRLTAAWHQRRTGQPHLWGEPRTDPPDEPNDWLPDLPRT